MYSRPIFFFHSVSLGIKKTNKSFTFVLEDQTQKQVEFNFKITKKKP